MLVTTTEIQVFLPIVGTAISTAIGYTVRFLITKVGIAKLERGLKIIQTHEKLAKTAVQFAQEGYSEMSGRARFDVASEYLASRLTKAGFKVDSSHVEALIKSALKEAKKDFGDAWQSSINATQIPLESEYIISEEDKSQTGQPNLK